MLDIHKSWDKMLKEKFGVKKWDEILDKLPKTPYQPEKKDILGTIYITYTCPTSKSSPNFHKNNTLHF
jgi:hypothetical protein